MNPLLLGALILYGLFLLFYMLWGFFLLYHLFRFAPHKDVAFVSAGLFLGVTVFLLLVSLGYFSRLDWSASFFIGTRS